MIENIRCAFKEYLEKYFAISIIFGVILAAISTQCFGAIVNDLNYDIWPLVVIAIVIAIFSYWLLDGPLSKTYAIITTIVGLGCGFYFADRNFSKKELIYTGYLVRESNQMPCAVVVYKDGPEYQIVRVWIADSKNPDYEPKLLQPDEYNNTLKNWRFKHMQSEHIFNGQIETIPIRSLRFYDYYEYLEDNPGHKLYSYPDQERFFYIDLYLLSKIEKLKNSEFSEKAKIVTKLHIYSPLNDE